MGLFTKKELKRERAKGLILSDEDNEGIIPNKVEYWSKEQFEQYLSTKNWAEDIKEKHRLSFKGSILIENGKITYYDL